MTDVKLRLTNTLTRTKEEFAPIDPNNVRMYVCGPTVYDFAHIGNARPVIVFDVLFRLLNHLAKQGVWDGGKGATKVTYVRNITDVDDKINDRALRDFGQEIADGSLSLNEAIRRVTEKTANQFHDDVKALGCYEPDHEPRATEHIDGMIDMVQALLDRGHAYVAQGHDGREALFDVLSMQEYGELSRRRLDEQQAGARVEVADHKRNPADFVLWKESNESEPGWDATFQLSEQNRNSLRLNTNTVGIRGRPGWHIECSAMSAAYLGEVFDIHGGGLDLIFPHHENEIAQSRCAHGTDVMANYWLHNGFLQVEGRKMSKSEGNFVTIHDLLHTEKFGGRSWPGEVLRLAMLMTHYREPIDFSVRRLEEAANLLSKWERIADKNDVAEGGNVKRMQFFEPLVDDLNTPTAIQELSKLVEWVRNPYTRKPASVRRVVIAMKTLGFERLSGKFAKPESLLLSNEWELLVRERLSLIAAKNWAEADRIRDELMAQGIQLKDGKDPATGERITTWEVKR